MLLAAQQVAGAPDFQVQGGDSESGAEIAELLERGQALLRDRRQVIFGGSEVGVGSLVGTADAAAKLVQLGEAEAIGTIDDDRVGARDVQAVFDDRRGDEHVGLSRTKSIITRSSSSSPIWPWPTTTRASGPASTRSAIE